MSKGINVIKKDKVKQGLLEGKSYKQSMIDAGYSKNTAINAWRREVVKGCLEEIEREFKESNITVEDVLKKIKLGQDLALKTLDLDAYGFFVKLEGQYLAMFTDKIKSDDTISPTYIINTIQTKDNKEIKDEN